ncbi:MAG: ABC-F family ATP-binding cassette domain-containing protein [SAR324 cluster bacterium]|nr:ABC-F family ATP-binding cassette domain-containing protein [SAR324 cluster bacterium]
MSPLITCSKLSYAVANRSLFEQIDLSINPNDRIALVGYNGSGKSTLLSLLNKSEIPDEGEIVYKKDLHLETVEQFLPEHLKSCTLFEALQQKTSEAQNLLSYQISALLHNLGFSREEFDYLVKDLSGGQQNRLMFARAVIHEPDLILFDEPTNHLDLGSILFFENYFKHSLTCAFLLISHDRNFLDSVSNRTLFLRDQNIYSYNLIYSQARSALADSDQAAMETRKNEEKKIHSLKISAKRLATWGKVYDNEKFARKAKNMEKRIEKLQEDKTFVSQGTDLSLNLKFSEARSDHLLTVHQKEIVFRKSNKKLFLIEDFKIRPGDRVALLGSNGHGKTTFIRTLVDAFQEETDSAGISFSPQCKIGYYDQELEQLDPQKTIFEILRIHCLGHNSELSHHLIQAGFPYQDHQKQVKVLSGGEKARIMFLLHKIERPNLLILDEPTNHIDIEGKEELEEQLMQSGASLLITSHDRRFVEIIATRFILIQNGKLVEIHDPQKFYDRELSSLTSDEPHETAQSSEENQKASLVSGSAEELLEIILELEEKLSADLQRKTKHQKPKLQEEWKEALRFYYEELEYLESSSQEEWIYIRGKVR